MHDLPSPSTDSAAADHTWSTAPASQGKAPTDPPKQQHSSAEQLAAIRAALSAATDAHDDHRLRRQHAHHAANLAADVILHPDSTDEQRRTAGTYLTRAVTLRDNPTPAR